MSEVSEAEQACLSANVNLNRLSTLLARATDLAPDDEMPAFIGCLEQDTVLRLFLTPFLDQIGPLSAESSACIRQGYADADLAALLLEAGSGPSQDPGAAIGRIMASLLVTLSCLNEEEFRAAGPALGMAPEDWQTLQCVQDKLGGPEGFAALLQPGAWPPLELLGAVSGCDLQLGGGPTPTPTPTPTATPTPTPTATPTPTPISYVLYENQELGVSFQRPEQWATAEPSGVPDEPDVSDEPEDPDAPEPPIEWLALVGDDGVSRLTLLTQIDDPDAPLSDRLDRAVAQLAPEETGAEIERSGPITLGDGSEAERAVVSYEDDDGVAAVRLVQVARRGGFTFVLVLSTPATEMERQQETFDTILSSFTSFPPAPYGIPRDRAFTMPLGEPSTLDPAIARDTTSHLFVASVFSGLVRFDDDLSVEPDLAEDWELDETGVVYTFTLRDGITFHDGRPITAEDFKYSIERAADPEVHSDTAALYLSDIVGVRERLDGDATEVSGVEAVDERTVRITIDAPKEYFLAKLAYPSSAVVDRLTVEPLGADWWMSDDVNGSGPFRLLRWDEEVVILQRFDDYHTPASLEHLISPLAALPGAGALDMYQTDAWDGLFVGARSLDRVREDPALSGQLREYEQLTSYFVALDGTRPPFDDPKVRRAFAMALDRERFIEEVYDGNVELANGLLPPGIPGYSESLRGIPFDPEAARQLLAESRYADTLPEIVFSAVDVDGEPPESVQFMLTSWREELGVDVRPDLLEPDVYYYQLEDVAGHLFTYPWVADYPDPENFLGLLYSEAHDARYINLTFDSLVERARVEQDRETRLGLYREAEQLLMDDAGIIPLFHIKNYALVLPHVDGFTITPFGRPSVAGITLRPIMP